MSEPENMGIAAAAVATLRARLEVRAGKALSLRDLAAVVGVGPSQITSIFNGSDPRLSTIQKIARGADMEVSELLALGEAAVREARAD